MVAAADRLGHNRTHRCRERLDLTGPCAVRPRNSRVKKLSLHIRRFAISSGKGWDLRLGRPVHYRVVLYGRGHTIDTRE